MFVYFGLGWLALGSIGLPKVFSIYLGSSLSYLFSFLMYRILCYAFFYGIVFYEHDLLINEGRVQSLKNPLSLRDKESVTSQIWSNCTEYFIVYDLSCAFFSYDRSYVDRRRRLDGFAEKSCRAKWDTKASSPQGLAAKSSAEQWTVAYYKVKRTRMKNFYNYWETNLRCTKYKKQTSHEC